MVIAPDDPRLDRCGFAKLQGEGVEVYARKTEILIGRQSKSTARDVVLGENMNVSRQHAKIAYNPSKGMHLVHISVVCGKWLHADNFSQLRNGMAAEIRAADVLAQVCGSFMCWERMA